MREISARAFLGTAETVIDIVVEKDPTKPTEPVKPTEPEVKHVYDVFSDISKNSPYVEAIQFVYDNELFSGLPGGKFSPDGEMNRAMFVTVLARLAGVDLSKYQSVNFDDVKITDWYGQAVAGFLPGAAQWQGCNCGRWRKLLRSR